MKEEYCQSCGTILRFPESARKVICDGCESEWTVVRTGSMISLSPAGAMQVLQIGQEETLQKRLKEAQRQILIKEDHCQSKQQEIESIIVVFQPVPLPAKIGALAAMLFFLAGAAGGWFFKQQLLAGGLAALSLAPFIGLFIYGRQINQREREKLLHKKELIVELASIKKEIKELKALQEKAKAEAVIEE